MYTAVAWAAVRHQSPVYDEPYHALSAWVQLHHHDFRIDNEDPPLWQYWASLPNGPGAIRADFADPRWLDTPAHVGSQWPWTVQTLYRIPGNDAARFIDRCRVMMLAVAVGLGGLIAWWAWRLGGPVAGVAATALFALDPNFLAHGPLMKNDVAFTLALTAMAVALWRVGRGVTAAGTAAVAVAAAAMLTIKFSGLVAVFIVPAVLAVRAVMAAPWLAFGRSLTTRFSRAMMASAMILCTAVVSLVSIWAVYDFRWAATPVSGVHLDLDALAGRATSNAAFVRKLTGKPPEPPTPGPAVRLAMTAARHHWLPEAYLAGFLFTYGNNLVRPAFLLGHRSLVGWWYYFPLAIAFKTPIATLAVGGLAAVALLRRRPWRDNPAGRWTAVALGVPFVLFLLSALSSNLNIGVRHVMPLLPLAFVAAGRGLSMLVYRRPVVRRWWVPVLAVGLATETAAGFPSYLAYFNAPSAALGHGGLDLLSDSNLDWGQGLVALAGWQHDHPTDTLYLSYFGLADPLAYGLRYVPLPGGYPYDQARRRFPDPARPCWLAVSVTNLQGTDLTDERLRPYYARLAARRPTAVLDGSIYLYRYDPAQEIRTAAGLPDR